MSGKMRDISSSKAAQQWVKTWRKVYNPLGFKHGYNFPLFVILAGAMMGFVLSRFMYLNIDGIFTRSTGPSDGAVYAQPGIKRIGIILHLAGILPAGFLVVFQFVPIIRYKAILFHRLNGYVILLLFIVSLIGVYIIIPTTVGGSLNTQVATGLFGAITTVSLGIAYYNIKILRIDLHREWMIRGWVYAGAIITQRLFILASLRAIQDHPQWNLTDVQTCASITAQYALFGVPPEANLTAQLYPACGVDPSTSVVVSANGSGPENASAALHIVFGFCIWLALIIHAIGVEIYFRFTQAESERLRIVSAERRAESGMFSARDQKEKNKIDAKLNDSSSGSGSGSSTESDHENPKP